MILKASQRGGARQLAVHLLRTDENDHVELGELRGFMADDLDGALREAYAVSLGTRCQQFLFSLSLSPPEMEEVPVESFEVAIANIEAKLGLTGQPRAIVFHEKLGRRHAHCVWSRIDAEAMRAINLPHFKLKLRDMSRELYLEHGWKMPAGLVNSAEQDLRNFTRAEWQQAKRAERDARELKEAFQDCWAISDSCKAYVQALATRGLYLARGDRRGFVAVDLRGEVYAVARWTGLRTKDVEARLGNPDDLPTVADTKRQVADLLEGVLGRHLAEVKAEYAARLQPLQQKRSQMREAQRCARSTLADVQSSRGAKEALLRAQRFRKGLRGLWDRLTGRHARTRQENEADASQAKQRDGMERHALIQGQLHERRSLQRELTQVRRLQESETASILFDMAHLDGADRTPNVTFDQAASGSRSTGPRKRQGPAP